MCMPKPCVSSACVFICLCVCVCIALNMRVLLSIQNNQGGYQYCFVGIIPTYLPSQNGQPLWILGDVFLMQYYSVYDRTGNQVGFATAA